MATISRLYNDYSDAQAVVRELDRAGVPAADISIVSSNADGRYSTRDGKTIVDRDGDGRDDWAEGAETGAGIGAAVGGLAGLLAGLGIMAIPGVGPVVAAGWLASTLAGAVAGGAAGGIIGALSQAGVSSDEAPVYAEGLRRGGAMVVVRTDDSKRMLAETILDRSAVNLKSRADAWRKQGWHKFDDSAPVYTPEQARAERDLYR
jgi:hypothetical protein